MRKEYYPSLDTYRAFACIAVLFFHAGVPGFSYGWLGVPMFFILSGFLITGILINSRDREDYFFRFYLRRIKRLFPIYYITLIVCIIFTHVFSSKWSYFFVWMQNVLLGISEFSPGVPAHLNHTWSLAVEQQFYLLWPAVLYYIRSVRSMTILFVCLFVTGIGSRYYLGEIFLEKSIAWTCLSSNLDMMSCGGGAFVLLKWTKEKSLDINRYLYWMMIGLFMLYCLGAVLFSLQTVWTGNIVLASKSGQWFYGIVIPVLTGVMILCITNQHKWVQGFLTLPLLRYVGKISYGLYLFHFPVFVYIDTLNLQSTFLIYALKFGITFTIAILSWRYFESRILNGSFQMKISSMITRRKA